MKTSNLFLIAFFLAGCVEQPTTVVDENQSTFSRKQSVNNEKRRKDKIKKCKKDSVRSVSGCWSVNQYNGHTGMLHLIQTGTVLSGNMDWYTFVDSPVVGSIAGDSISYELAYPDLAPLIGYYRATLDATGNLLVNGFTESNNGHSAAWDATKTACPVAP